MSANAGATVVIAMLVAVLAGRVVLLSFATPVLQAQSLLESRQPAREPARLVLVVDRDDAYTAGRAAIHVQKEHPGRDLEVHRISWAAPERRNSRATRLAALVRTYGYSGLPVLLTVSREGQVVRVQSLND